MFQYYLAVLAILFCFFQTRAYYLVWLAVLGITGLCFLVLGLKVLTTNDQLSVSYYDQNHSTITNFMINRHCYIMTFGWFSVTAGLDLSSQRGILGDSGNVLLGLFAEEQDGEESDKKKKTKKGTKRKRDGKGQEQGTMAYDPKLDDMLDRTLEDGAKQHNLTAVNVRNILHVSRRGQLLNLHKNFHIEQIPSPLLLLCDQQFCPLCVTKCFTS